MIEEKLTDGIAAFLYRQAGFLSGNWEHLPRPLKQPELWQAGEILALVKSAGWVSPEDFPELAKKFCLVQG